MTTRVARAARRRLSGEAGFGLVELVIAMSILAVGVLALVGAFGSGYVAINRATTVSAATAVADKTMESFRAMTYTALSAQPAPTSPQTGPDGRTYTVAAQYQSVTPPSGRPVIQVTVSVTRNGRTWVQESSTFDQLTGS